MSIRSDDGWRSRVGARSRGSARDGEDLWPAGQAHGIDMRPDDGRCCKNRNVSRELRVGCGAAVVAGMGGQMLGRPAIIGSQSLSAEVVIRPRETSRKDATEENL